VVPQQAATFSLGDRVWKDLNMNGIQDAGDPGINGVIVKLISPTGPVKTTITASVNGVDGVYKFTGLLAGTYTVDVDGLSPALAGLSTTVANAGANRALDSNSIPTTTMLSSANPEDLTLDFGYVAPCTGVIGDFIWKDTNENGTQSFGEPGIGGVKVSLFSSLGALLATTTTNSLGKYSFPGLCGGTYKVEVDTTTVPMGYWPTRTLYGSDRAKDSNANPTTITLNNNASDLTLDFGFTIADGCTYTQGYWKTHSSSWPVQSLVLGGVTYTKAEALAILGTSVNGDASISLAYQLIAAKLNVAKKAAVSSTVAGWINTADSLLAQAASTRPGKKLPTFSVRVGDPLYNSMVTYGNKLDDYNNGRYDACHCN
jgi:hypothetical protein